MSKFEIKPRDAAVGGGWHLRPFEDDTEVGGGVFPIEENVSSNDAYEAAVQEGENWLRSQRGIES